jgi:threonylcarbamoyladenosine tRNA methylthiotransferase MtaB
LSVKLNVKTRHPSFTISTFGCKVNQYESQVIRERLLAAGYREDNGFPQLVIINSCAVTARAEAKTRKEIRSWLRRSPESRLLLVGCGLTYSQSQNRGLWEIVPPDRRGKLPDNLHRDGPWLTTFSADHSRAFIKVQDGCDSFCSYCIIPYLRGGSVSRSMDEILQEVSGLVGNGYREIVLTGINMGIYGKDLPGYHLNLVLLLEQILKLKGAFRIRLSSIEPKEIPPSLIRLIANEEKLCPHLHIPLQSGSDKVLRKMNRNYTSGEYIDIIRNLRSSSPNISISTDCLVGFPGEDDDAFQASCRLVREIGFSKVHIFPYSRREGTVASRYPGLDRELISHRAKILAKISAEKAREFRQSFIGKEVEVIIERKTRNGLYSGLDSHYNRVHFFGEKIEIGSLCRIRITGIDESSLKGEFAGD